MSDNEGNKSGKGWTDRQRNAPRPDGKSVGACRIMVDRLKGTLKSDLAALRGLDDNEVNDTPKKAATPRKRKAKGEDAGSEDAATPTKRGQKKKSAEVVEEAAEDAAAEEEEGGKES
ncbi:hypothetical protein TW65_02070 [Stemphylium lycopersici]|nr:hypothetical protein TW65_02070 [Stemphylium lycopersici]